MSLRDLLLRIEDIDWTKIEKVVGMNTKYSDDDVIAQCFPSITKDTGKVKAGKIQFRFGANVADRLGIQVGDKVNILYDNSDIYNFLIVKSQTKSGYKVSRDAGSQTRFISITFKWPHENYFLDKSSPKALHYEIDKKRLVFNLRDYKADS